MRCLLTLINRLGHLEVFTPTLYFIFPGIYYEPKCKSESVDHAVLVVGYGFEGADSDDNKYWLVKNRYKMPQILIFEVEKGSPFWNQHLNSGPQILKYTSEVLCHLG